MHELVRANPLATLVTLSARGLNADHLPMILWGSPVPLGTLRFHLARENPVWREARGNREALAVFQGPAAYISPSWYATKKETGKVVPTWNYAVVHAYGPLRVVEDREWLRSLLEAMVARNEAPFPEPWAISDAPTDYIERAMDSIVGIEMAVSRLCGKWKTSQNHPSRNRASVAAGLRAIGGAEADAMAALVESVTETPASAVMDKNGNTEDAHSRTIIPAEDGEK